MSPPVDIRPPANPPTRHSERARRAGLAVLVTVASLLVLWVMVVVAFRDPAFVERVRFDNPSGFDINVDIVHGQSRLPLGVAAQQCTTQFQDVIDAGDTWIVRFATQGRDGGELSVTREQLERDGWTLRIPDEVIGRFTSVGTPPAPRHSCVQ